MDQSFHYLIMINQALFQKKALSGLMEIGLTPGQPKVLDYLVRHDGSMQKDIAYGCQIDPATLTGILARMEGKGLVERRMMDGNRRSNYVYLTENGREKEKKVAEIFLEIEEEVFKGIGKEEREQFMNVFYKICCNMTDTEGLQ
ncbi:MarR family winged helix-turn-helix transcriptional regulator [Marinisporobacter balticus]|uniref:DNA-binding MarR family transcriptional regulator n=1 Tax=Marinisporobacter balticus TaxID=2018667 RepID=A0A4R2L2E9_9FIRM|nr:MarR family transcriptional regulator [Marinisporobacter balticus]TCO79387.1 DNA-binding MarR family transcriptional regulator [Marinisporobacter balticus]